MTNRGKLIILTGIDGCGKSTHVQLLSKKLENLGYSVVTGRSSPRKMSMHKTIQSIRHRLAAEDIKFPLEIRAICLAVAMYDYIEKEIMPALDEGKIVILDRYVESTFVYLKGRNIEYRWPKTILDLLPEPDLTIYLDISPDVAVSRIVEREEIQIHERPEILGQIHKVFTEYVKDHPAIKCIGSERDMDEVHKEVVEVALALLNGD